MNAIQSGHVQTSIPQRSQIAWWRDRTRGARSQTAVNSCRLRTIFESVDRGQMAVTAQRVCWITMRITSAYDRAIVPQQDFVYEAHQIGVGDQRANFGFVDLHEIEVVSTNAVVPSESRDPVAKAYDIIAGSFDSSRPCGIH
jgi:hypothetical protein